VSAEADAVAGIPTGQTENIRPAVAAMRRAIQNRPPEVGVSADTCGLLAPSRELFLWAKIVLNEKYTKASPFFQGFSVRLGAAPPKERNYHV
jgi:hypothetical protein